MAVESPVHPALNPALEGVEDSGRDQNAHHQAPLGQTGMDHQGNQRNDAEVAAQQQRSS